MKRIGYGQVEPNHLSGQVTGQIFAQLPAASTITQLENGQLAKYDEANGQVTFSSAADGEYMLVMNEIKLYDERHQGLKDFCAKASDFYDGKIYPRLIKLNVGDTWTTNTLDAANSGENAVYDSANATSYQVGNYLEVNANGFLQKKASGTSSFKVVKVYTMPDGQTGIKVMKVS